MKKLLIGILLLSISACGYLSPSVDRNAVAKARLMWEHKANGDKRLEVENGQDIQGLHAKTSLDEHGNVKDVDISLEKSSTSEAAMAAWGRAQEATMQLMSRFLDKMDAILIAAGQAAAASKGVPLPALPRTGGANVPAPIPGATP